MGTSEHRSLHDQGFTVISMPLTPDTMRTLRESLFKEGEVGKRCLLDEPVVREVAIEIRKTLLLAGFLPDAAVAIQAIAFDKTSSANWKVTWHQDLMFPFAAPVTSTGFSLPSKKEGVDYARPPQQILEELLAVRLHLDDCDETNGPLRVSPGSHLNGIIKSADIPVHLSQHGELICLAKAGEALLMKPLILHASSQATVPKHRRVLHLVYHKGNPMEEQWHRNV